MTSHNYKTQSHDDTTTPAKLTPQPGTPAYLSRRSFLAAAGAALVAQMLPHGGEARAAASAFRLSAGLPSRPNILLIVTDQERYPRHWPAGWAETNLPNRQRIADRGLSFTNAYCNACMCSPSRSTLFTGVYPAQHGVVDTLTNGGTESPNEPQLPVAFQNMAKVLASAGYNVQYRGKWHLSKGADGGKPTASDIAAYGFNGWVEPDSGEDTALENFGGGDADHDANYAQQAAAFLSTQTPQSTASQPFALIVSFVNPHDVLAYPQTLDGDATYSADTTKFNQGINYSDIPTRDEDLLTNNKPTPQAQSLALLAGGLGPLPTDPQRQNYVNFYAYLQKVVDTLIGTVLDALEAQGLWDSTIVIRTSDHGEMGLAHGGLRQKVFNVYQETMNIPLVFANPILFPQPRTTAALASLVDILPTLASLANIPSPNSWVFKGYDLSPLLYDTATAVQDAILFTFDDEKAGAPNGQQIVTQPNHIRCIFDGTWKYARYFDSTGGEVEQYELYDLQTDPNELNNQAASNPEKSAEMAAKLAALENDRLGPLYRTWLPIIRR
jgi:arylsulfatase A-like enzyme